MRGACWFVLSLLVVFAASGAVEGRLLAKAAATSKAKADGDADVEAAGSEDEDATEVAGGEEEEATDEAGGEEEQGEEEEDGEDDSPVSFVQEESGADAEDREEEEHGEAEDEDEDKENTAEFMQDADLNKDGKLSLEELQQFAENNANDLKDTLSGEEDGEMLAASQQGLEAEKSKMAGFLAVADQDKDGFINAKELPTLLKAMDDADQKEDEKEAADEEHEDKEDADEDKAEKEEDTEA